MSTDLESMELRSVQPPKKEGRLVYSLTSNPAYQIKQGFAEGRFTMPLLYMGVPVVDKMIGKGVSLDTLQPRIRKGKTEAQCTSVEFKFKDTALDVIRAVVDREESSFWGTKGTLLINVKGSGVLSRSDLERFTGALRTLKAEGYQVTLYLDARLDLKDADDAGWLHRKLYMFCDEMHA